MLKILMADDHAMFRRGTRDMLIERYPSIVIEEAADGDDMLRHAHKRHWDVFIMDLTMPGTSGIELIGALRRRHPSTPVLVLSMHPESLYAIPMLKAGASGYLHKATSTEEVMAAIAHVVAGHRYVSSETADSLVETLQAKAAPRHTRLSDRELDVLRMLAAGQPLTEIARHLGISRSTVSTYRGRLLQKLALSGNADVTRYALHHRLLN
jgi:DNA-binding NarL/FixJ family response regulator